MSYKELKIQVIAAYVRNYFSDFYSDLAFSYFRSYYFFLFLWYTFFISKKESWLFEVINRLCTSCIVELKTHIHIIFNFIYSQHGIIFLFYFCLFVGVQKILVHGSNLKNCKEALRLTRIYPRIIYSSAGIHPMDSKNVIDDPCSWSEFEEIAKQAGNAWMSLIIALFHDFNFFYRGCGYRSLWLRLPQRRVRFWYTKGDI